MNKKTAEHLNRLQDLSAPVKFTDRNVPKGSVLWDGSSVSDVANRLEKRIAAIIEAQIPAETAAEIREAAAERRTADVLHVVFHVYDWRRCDAIPWYFTKRLWAACRSQIAEVIKADNEARLAEYEAYRKACEQGVAVPPATEEKG